VVGLNSYKVINKQNLPLLLLISLTEVNILKVQIDSDPTAEI